MGIDLSMDNMATFTLFVNFTGFIPQYPCNTLSEKFILWKRYYDEYVTQQAQLTNKSIFNTAPKDPRQLKPTKIQNELATLNTEDYAFQNFTFQNESTTKHEQTQAPNHNQQTPYEMNNLDNIEVLEENITHVLTTATSPKSSYGSAYVMVPQTSSPPQSSSPSPPPPPPYTIPTTTPTTTAATIHPPPSHHGKNIHQMKLIYSQGKKPESESKPQRPTPKKRKRKEQPIEEEEQDTTPLPPGRPTKDTALIRDAKNEDSGNDDDSQYGLVDVQLLSGSGTIRKKLKLLTKNEGDVKCFAIRHYSALEYIAGKKKKAFNIIKHQRQTLKKLNYLEQNTLKDVKDLKLLYNV